MATRELMQKYLPALKEIGESALRNMSEANDTMAARSNERKTAQQELAALKEDMKTQRGFFFGCAKSIIKMAYKQPEKPEEIDEVLEPIMAYQMDLSAIPEAKQACLDATDAELAAQEELEKATDFYGTIASLLNFDQTPDAKA